jgi:hypothetical protein
MLFDSSYTTPASTTWKRVEANQTYGPKHNLQIGRTLLSNGLPGCYLRLCCFDVHGHRHDLQSRTTGASTILTALALVAAAIGTDEVTRRVSLESLLSSALRTK